jgi:hypothetical protein
MNLRHPKVEEFEQGPFTKFTEKIGIKAKFWPCVLTLVVAMVVCFCSCCIGCCCRCCHKRKKYISRQQEIRINLGDLPSGGGTLTATQFLRPKL